MFGTRKGTSADLLVIGLGNPSSEYQDSRHNVGARAAELLAKRHGETLKLGKERALVTEIRFQGKRVAIGFPQTFMNESGGSVRALVKRYGIESLDQLVIIHDELDLPVGQVRVKLGGGLAGHNGLKSVVQHLKSEEFGRIRIGIGRPTGNGADYVLKRPSKADADLLAIGCEQAADAAEKLVNEDYQAVMTVVNAQ